MNWLAVVAGWLLGPGYHALVHLASDDGCVILPGLIPCPEESSEAPSAPRIDDSEHRGLRPRRLLGVAEDVFLRNCREDDHRYSTCLQAVAQMDHMKGVVTTVVVLLAVLTLFVIVGWPILGFNYRMKVTGARERVAGRPFPEAAEIAPLYQQGGRREDFYPSLFDCCDHWPTCQWSFCVYPVRMGDTYGSIGVSHFWLPSCVFYAGLAVIVLKDVVLVDMLRIRDLGTWFDITVALCQAGIYACWRMKLRARMGNRGAEEGPPGGSYPLDVLALFCCLPCAVAQEARSVDGAWGLDVGCPWNLVSTEKNFDSLVGQPARLEEEDRLVRPRAGPEEEESLVETPGPFDEEGSDVGSFR